MKRKSLEKHIEKHSLSLRCGTQIDEKDGGLHVIMDPGGKVFSHTAAHFMDSGYLIKVLNFNDPKHSHCFNPLDFCLQDDGKPDMAKVRALSGYIAEPLLKDKNGWYWESSSETIIAACITYLLEFRLPEERTLPNVLSLICNAKTDEYHPEKETKLDRRFNEAIRMNPEGQCFALYDIYKLASGRAANSVLFSAALAMSVFADPDVQNLVTTDHQVISRSAETMKIRKYQRDGNGNLIRTDQNIVPDELVKRPDILYIIYGKNSGLSDIIVPFMIDEIASCTEKTGLSAAFYFDYRFIKPFSSNEAKTDITEFVQCSEKRLSRNGDNFTTIEALNKILDDHAARPKSSDSVSGNSFRNHKSDHSKEKAGLNLSYEDCDNDFAAAKHYKNYIPCKKAELDSESSKASLEETYRKKSSIAAAEKCLLDAFKKLNKTGKSGKYLHELFFAGFNLSPDDKNFYNEGGKCEEHIEKLLNFSEDKECLESFSVFKNYPYQIRCKALYLASVDLNKK